MANDKRLARQNSTLRSASAARCAVILALFACQSAEVSESYTSLANSPIWAVPGWSIAALFALAGFTAMRSVERHGIATVAGRALMRFLPALVIVVVVTALLLGATMSSEGWRSYFLDPDVLAYLTNIFGVLRYTLPGVFEFNASAQMVNPVLWVVAVGYVAAAIMALTQIRPRWTNWVVAIFVLLFMLTSLALFALDVPLGEADGVVNQLFAGQGLASLLAFLLGALIYRLRQYVVIDWRFATLAGVTLMLAAAAGNKLWLGNAVFANAVALPVAYLAVYACSLPLPFRHELPRAEPLYWRMLLWAYPIQQVWVAVGPDRQSWSVNLLLSTPVIVALAAGQWFILERPPMARLLPASLKPFTPDTFRSDRRSRRAGYYANRAKEALPVIGVALLIVLFVLAALAMTVFAMQRDAGGA